ncbi:class B sortase [Clostridium sp. DL1XJH146]
MILYTPAGDFLIELFAGVVVDGNYESVRFDFNDEHDFENYIDILKKESTFKSNTIVKNEDRIITLCTCSYEFNNARYTLYGKLKTIE